MLRYTIIIGVAVALCSGAAMAEDNKPAVDKTAKTTVKAAVAKPAAKAPAANPGDKLQVTVVSVSGLAEKRSASEEKAEWSAVKAGDVLDEMTLLRTGLGGKIVLKFADRGDVTVKSGTKIGIASFRKRGKLVQTRVGLKYGAIRAQVDSSRGANDFRLRTPAGTLAARGTGGHFAMWGDFLFQGKGTGGAWGGKISSRVLALIAGQWTDSELKMPLSILLDKYGITLGDEYGGLTPSELKNLLMNGGGRGIIGFIGNPRNPGSPKLILPGVVPMVAPVGGPIDGSDDPDRYIDDPERGRDRSGTAVGGPLGGSDDPGRYVGDPERGRDR